MNTCARKEREELAFAKRTLRMLPGLEPWHVKKTESPDALVITRDRTVGLEIRRIFRQESRFGSPLRQQEDFRRKIVAEAESIYAQKGGRPISVSVHYNGTADSSSYSRKQLSEALVNIVEKNMPALDGRKEESYNYINREYFPDFFDTICVYRFTDITRSNWFVPGADYLEPLTPNHITTAIAAKETKINSYREKATHIWLLIVTEHGELSSFFQYPEATFKHTYRTSFERLLLLNWFSRRIYELNVEPLENPARI